eukprot:m.164444 g.164444  ORF g.164444 m.164444 type:complete len:1829 (+) comp38880_c0_seq2:1554-7040(+)
MFKSPFGGGGLSGGTGAGSIFGQNKPFGTGGTTGLGGSMFTGGTAGAKFGGTAGGGLFGQQTTTQTSQSSALGGFQSGGIFGAGGSGLGAFQSPQQQTQAGSGLFGQKTATGLGGGIGSGLYNSGNTGGAGTGLFSQSGQAQPQVKFGGTVPFNAGTAGGLFGQSSAFSQTAPPGTPLKFQPSIDSDAVQRPGGYKQSITTALQVISGMKEYEQKSLEELRFEDYQLNRRGQQSSGGGLFPQQQQQQQQQQIRGLATGLGGGIFGQQQQAGLGGGGLGQTGGVFGQQNQGGLFANQQNKPVGLFGNQTGGLFSVGTGNTGLGLGNQAGSVFGQQAAGLQLGGGGLQQGGNLFGNKPGGLSLGGGLGQNTGLQLGGGGNMFGNQAAIGGLQLGGGGLGTSSLQFGGAGSSLGLGGMSGGGGLLNANRQTTGLSLGGGLGSLATSSSGLGFGSGLGGGLKLGGGLGTGGLGLGNSLGLSGLGNQGSLGLGLGGGSAGVGAGMAVVPQQELLKLQLQALKNSPFGDSPLFRNATEEAQKSGRANSTDSPVSSHVVKATVTAHYKMMPRPATRIKPRRIVGKSHLFDDDNDDDWDGSKSKFDILVPRKSVKTLVIKPRSTPEKRSFAFDSEQVPLSMSHGVSTPSSNSVLSALITPRKNGKVESSTPQPTEVAFPAAAKQPSSVTGILNTSEELLQKKYPSLDDSVSILKPQFDTPVISSPAGAASADDSFLSGASASDYEPSSNGPSTADPLTGITLTKTGYYTKPSMSELQSLAETQSDSSPIEVDNFEVGREGYGCVTFEGKTDVRGLNLDEIVHIKAKEICVYPDDDNKPSTGQGLNKKALVRLEGTWPTDKTTRQLIKDPQRLLTMHYSEKVERSTIKMGAIFVDYKPDTGSWIFTVDHFSKYGLVDDDSDDEAVGKKRQKVAASAGQSQQPPVQPLDALPAGSVQPTSQPEAASLALDGDAEMKDSEGDEEGEEESLMDEETIKGQSERTAAALKINPQHLQVMKASFFGEDEGEEGDDDASQPRVKLTKQTGKSPGFIPWKLRSSSKSRIPLRSSAVQSPVFTPREELSPASSILSLHKSETSVRSYPASSMSFRHSQLSSRPVATRVPAPAVLSREKRVIVPVAWNESYFKEFHEKKDGYRHPYLSRDMAAFMGRSFRVGWGPNGVLAHLGSPLVAAEKKEKADADMSFTIIGGRRSMSLRHSPFYTVTIEKVNTSPRGISSEACFLPALNVALQHSDCYIDKDKGVPHFRINKGVQIIHDMATVAQQMSKEFPNSQMLEQFDSNCQLCIALWGRLDEVHDNGTEVDPTAEASSYMHRIARRRAVADWLSVTGMKQVESKKEKNYIDKLCSLLSADQIGSACQLAQGNGDHRLAMLIAQTGGSDTPRALCLHQLNEWEKLKADTVIGPNYLKEYTLLAARTSWSGSSRAVVSQTCENLHWQRSLSLHLNFECSVTAAVSFALELYCNAFKGRSGTVALPPNPPYLKETAPALKFIDSQGLSGTVRDLSFHLLKLYRNRLHRLERSLAPITHTSCLLDYRASWFLGVMLRAVYYEHLPDYNHQALHTDFASQLESLGLWKWAIFVLLHLHTGEDREMAVKQVLARQCKLESDGDEKDEFLTKRLHIPVEWIHEAKALRAQYDRNSEKEAEHCLKAGLWNAAHSIIMTELAAKCIISGNEGHLLTMLEQLAVDDHCSEVTDWRKGGKILLDYLVLRQEMGRLNECDSDVVDQLQRRVASLCVRVIDLSCVSLEDRLCQSEISRKCASYLKTLSFLTERPDEEVILDDSALPPLSLAPYIANLPMPEEYTLSELKALTQSYVAGLVQ